MRRRHRDTPTPQTRNGLKVAVYRQFIHTTRFKVYIWRIIFYAYSVIVMIERACDRPDTNKNMACLLPVVMRRVKP